MTTKLHIDIETFSSENLKDCGVHRYAAAPDFAVLLLAYAFDEDCVRVVDIASGESVPARVLNALMDDRITKVAHNAVFERVCLTRYLRSLGLLGPGITLNPTGWDCTMVRAYRAGLPGSLADVGKALGLEECKMAVGRVLISRFCCPTNSGPLIGAARVMPQDAPDDWETFKAYCIRDVEVERNIDRALEWVVVTDKERELYECDQRINDRGVAIDLLIARNGDRLYNMEKAGLVNRARELTGLDNPNSVPQLRNWLEARMGVPFDKLRKDDIDGILTTTDDPVIHEVLNIRRRAGKSSNAKYGAMLKSVGADGRIRGLLQHYGTRTGRWAGRLVQLQNLPKNKLSIDELTFARQLLRDGDASGLQLCFGNVPDTTSQLIRTALIAPEGKTFVVCDFSAIEARVLAWLAEEQWVLESFRRGEDIYCSTASKMFHVAVEKHGQNADLRQKGKVAVLALGYGGGVGALDKMGGQTLGMTAEEEQDTVDKWRAANPHIVAFWRQVEKMVRLSLEFPKDEIKCGKLVLRMHGETLAVRLPSGREICYYKMRYDEREGRLQYMGVDQKTNTWKMLDTFGGKLVENITQAVARDCLAEVLIAVERECPDISIVFHVHDEIVCEVPEYMADEALRTVNEIFSRVPSWATGLPLKGAGYMGKFYYKD